MQLFAFSLTIATDANAVTSTSADANPTAHKIDRQFRQPVEFIVGETVAVIFTPTVTPHSDFESLRNQRIEHRVDG